MVLPFYGLSVVISRWMVNDELTMNDAGDRRLSDPRDIMHDKLYATDNDALQKLI